MRALVAEGDTAAGRYLKRVGRRYRLGASPAFRLVTGFVGRLNDRRLVSTCCVVLCVVVVGCSPAILTLDGLVLVRGQESMLLAQLEREPVLGFRDGIENVRIRFRVDGRQVAEQLTADEGRASTFRDLSPASGAEFEAIAVVDGRTVRTTGSIFDWRDDLTIIAVDIDGTISDTDYDDLIFDDEDKDSTPILNSREALFALANDFHLVYVTGRPRFLLEKTRAWLATHGFPPGPVIAAGGLRDFLRQGGFKRETLARFRQCWPNLLIGIGDKHRDAEAYRANGMLPVIVTANDVARKRRTWQVAVVPGWEDVTQLFAVNHRLLSDPRALADTINNHCIQGALADPSDVSRQ
ncbi:MAG: hypothetical protein JXQ73_17700 [Phycisphaerae bacterium]|nr:hypothetical protein [Phycisphaerae bacterium]